MNVDGDGWRAMTAAHGKTLVAMSVAERRRRRCRRRAGTACDGVARHNLAQHDDTSYSQINRRAQRARLHR